MSKLRIHLIEDNEGDVRLIEEALKEYRVFELINSVTLKRGLQLVRNEPFDASLLDLGLPDCQGLESFIRLYTENPAIPIIVLTGHDDYELALKSIRAGAQDYLLKGGINPELLVRSIRYAIERQKLIGELESALQHSSDDREQSTFDRLSEPGSTTLAARIYGNRPISDDAPKLFSELTEQYAGLLEHALEKKVTRINAPMTTPLRNIAAELGGVAAGPKDVIDVHKAALISKCKDVPPEKESAYTLEGRFLLLELMGYLVSFYRHYYPGSVQQRNELEGKKDG